MKKKNLILMALAIMVVVIPFIQGCEKKRIVIMGMMELCTIH